MIKMKTLYSIYVISMAAMITGVFALMSHTLRHGRARRVVARATSRTRIPFNARTLYR
jgi:hypothetical protein